MTGKSDSVLEVIILAAGKGTRMRSRLPKVLHPLGAMPMLGHVLNTVEALRAARVHVVVGAGTAGDAVRAEFAGRAGVNFVLQAEQKGTGDAVHQALEDLAETSDVLVLTGDVPLITVPSLERLTGLAGQCDLALLTAHLQDPAHLGRIVRDGDGNIQAIVEFVDASAPQRQICEINTGILLTNAASLRRWLPRLRTDNAKGEYYLTDVVAMAVAEGQVVASARPDRPEEVAGINDRVQLARDERIYQRRQAEALMRAGATLRDPARVDVRGQIEVGEDTTIDVNVVFEGHVSIGSGVSIGPHCHIRDAVIEDGAVIHASTVINGALIGPGASIGPFARLRPGTDLDAGVQIGNFVETKKTHVGRGTKSNHLAYLGDSEIGAGCNIGAGTITCNYDGHEKFPTTIGDRVFVGSNSTLVAPVKLGNGAYIGAGSTVTDEVPETALAVARGRQTIRPDWVHPALRDGDPDPASDP